MIRQRRPPDIFRIKEMLDTYGTCPVRMDTMDMVRAGTFALKHGLSIDVQKVVNGQGQTHDCYVFRVDSQREFKHKLQERRRWQRWGRLISFGILSSVIFLALLVWKGR